ncbi:hypothetical protein EK904_011967, partial [Melospiza melodia maxima]
MAPLDRCSIPARLHLLLRRCEEAAYEERRYPAGKWACVTMGEPMVFYGMTTEETILREISVFWELLGPRETVLRGTYIVASYENPSVPQRRNEIWFICQP